MTALEEIKKAEHERIWLEPAGAPDRCWCQDNQWGDEGVEYVLASTLDGSQAEENRLRAIALDMQAGYREATARAEAAEAEVKRLNDMLSGCDWYWPEEDTSSDACADGPWAIAETYDLKPADVLAYSRGGVVETRYFAFLPPADDSDSDDNFEVDETTEEAVAAKITAEIERRTALASTGGEHNAE